MSSSFETRMTSAPYARIVLTLSSEAVSGIIKRILYPFIAATIASAMPVFPLVASIKVSSFLINPNFSASSIILSAARSLTEPPGLFPSNFANILFLLSNATSTSGVLPIRLMRELLINYPPLLQQQSINYLYLILKDGDG